MTCRFVETSQRHDTFTAVLCSLFLFAAGVLWSDPSAADDHATSELPQLSAQIPSSVDWQDRQVTITFGPLDIEDHAQGHIPVPASVFFAPNDLVIVGYQASVGAQDGTPLPKHYLHHVSVLDSTRPSTFCEGAPYLLGGSGVEMTGVRFPPGHGVPVAKGAKLLAGASFYDHVEPRRGVVIRLTLHLAPEGEPATTMRTHHISVTSDCYRRFAEAGPDETDEGLRLSPGVTTRSIDVSFPFDGCVKFAYAHAHDYLALMLLDNLSSQSTLLRTAPQLDEEGKLLGFSAEQVFSDARGFPINRRDRYRLTMVYHRPLHERREQYGMATYLLYLTPSPCPAASPFTSPG